MIDKPNLTNTYENLVKHKEDGKKIVGVIPHTIVPDELIYAALTPSCFNESTWSFMSAINGEITIPHPFIKIDGI